MNDIKSVIEPNSIAVVGASNRPGSVGLAVFKNLLWGRYKGILYPVNSKSKSILGVKSYANLLAIEDQIELCVIIVPPESVIDVLKDADKCGIKGCIIISAGFKEAGLKGIELEQQVRDFVHDKGIRLVGPNCLGIINTNENVSMNASFSRTMPLNGNIAFISQSGALCSSVLDYAAGKNIGFSKFVSIGNKADMNEIDFLNYLIDDNDTHVILMYLEDISDGHAFMEIAREITWDAGKPIIAVKSGTSSEGASAAASHTGSLSGSDDTYEAIFKQSGIIRVVGIEELFHYAAAFSKQPLPKGNRIAIITNAGGPGIMATDAAIRYGLKLTNFSEQTVDKLRACLPQTANIRNPVDIIGDATCERYESAVSIVLNDKNVDAIIVILTPQAMTDINKTAQILCEIAMNTDKAILASFMGGWDVSKGIECLAQNNIPNYLFPEAAARSLSAMADFNERREQRKTIKMRFIEYEVEKESVNAIIRQCLNRDKEYYMTVDESNELLRFYGFPILKNRVITDKSEIYDAVLDIGFPLVMKVISRNIIHKSDVGGVRININTKDDAVKAYNHIIADVKANMPDALIEGVIIEQMADKGIEVILGSARDPIFGPLCMFGLGGIFVEALRDVAFRLAPMWEVSAENMIRSIRGYRIFEGARSNFPSDIDSVKECILKLSQLVSDHPEIMELDINPLIVHTKGKGCSVADSRIFLKVTQKA
ncbi:MAG: acetate--CoA ligase family protein, partial [Deltaproteobacteria bacterium]|nr:acetate--CoA ligase family protein [Deltaproteobacteria bacterium]